MKKILKKVVVPVTAGLIALNGAKAQDSLNVDLNVEQTDSTNLVLPDSTINQNIRKGIENLKKHDTNGTYDTLYTKVEEKLEGSNGHLAISSDSTGFPVQDTTTYDSLRNKYNMPLPKVVSLRDSVISKGYELEDLIKDSYDNKTSLSDEDKITINEAYEMLTDSAESNKYTLTPNTVSKLFEIKNAIDLEDAVVNLKEHVGDEKSFRDDSREGTLYTLPIVSELYGRLKNKKSKSELTEGVLDRSKVYLKDLHKSTLNFLEEEYDDGVYAPGLSRSAKNNLEETLNYGRGIVKECDKILGLKTEVPKINLKSKSVLKKKRPFYNKEFNIAVSKDADAISLGYNYFLTPNVGVGIEVFDQFTNLSEDFYKDIINKEEITNLGTSEVYRLNDLDEVARAGVLGNLVLKYGRLSVNGGAGVEFSYKNHTKTEGLSQYDTEGNTLINVVDPSTVTKVLDKDLIFGFGLDVDLTSRLSLGAYSRVKLDSFKYGLPKDADLGLKASFKLGKDKRK